MNEREEGVGAPGRATDQAPTASKRGISSISPYCKEIIMRIGREEGGGGEGRERGRREIIHHFQIILCFPIWIESLSRRAWEALYLSLSLSPWGIDAFDQANGNSIISLAKGTGTGRGRGHETGERREERREDLKGTQRHSMKRETSRERTRGFVPGMRCH